MGKIASDENFGYRKNHPRKIRDFSYFGYSFVEQHLSMTVFLTTAFVEAPATIMYQ